MYFVILIDSLCIVVFPIQNMANSLLSTSAEGSFLRAFLCAVPSA